MAAERGLQRACLRRTPTAWKSATAPDEALAAPNALSWSSFVSAGRPTMAGTSVPARSPTT